MPASPAPDMWVKHVPGETLPAEFTGRGVDEASSADASRVVVTASLDNLPDRGALALFIDHIDDGDTTDLRSQPQKPRSARQLNGR